MSAETPNQTTRMSKTAQEPTQNGMRKGGRPRKRPTDPPSDLDAKSKQFWKRTLDQLSSQGTWQDSEVDGTRALCPLLRDGASLAGQDPRGGHDQGLLRPARRAPRHQDRPRG
jgi:hypothetical protein